MVIKTTFRCKQSGNTVSFTDETDIASMRKEEHYEEIKDDAQDKQETNAVEAPVPPAQEVNRVPRRGRPPKTEDSVLSI